MSGVSFDFEPGKRTVLLGANGTGKSSLMWAIMGIVNPSAGEIEIEGLSPSDPASIGEIRSLLGFVGQRPDDLIVSTTVESEVAFGPENLRIPQDELRRRVTESLALVGLEGFEKREPASLSGGQKQRLVMAAALAAHPKYLLLDEPCAMLDPASAEAMLALIDRLKDEGMGMLHITHNLSEAKTADEIVVLHNKSVVFKGSFEDLLAFEDSFLEWGIELETPSLELDFDLNKTETPEAESVYDLAHLNLSYETVESDKVRALEDINLDIRAGEFVLIEGESGAGKTSLLKILSGAIQADKGSTALFENAPLNMKATRGKVGLVFQDAEQSFFSETVLEEVMFGPLQMGHDKELAQAKSEEVLRSVGLEPDTFAERLPFNLSGGEARRLALASVLSFSPSVILADEPTASLDAPSRYKVRSLLAQEARDKTVIVVSHAPDEFTELAHKHYRISAGRLINMRADS